MYLWSLEYWLIKFFIFKWVRKDKWLRDTLTCNNVGHTLISVKYIHITIYPWITFKMLLLKHDGIQEKPIYVETTMKLKKMWKIFNDTEYNCRLHDRYAFGIDDWSYQMRLYFTGMSSSQRDCVTSNRVTYVASKFYVFHEVVLANDDW